MPRQIHLTKTAATEISALPKLLQLEVLSDFNNLPENLDSENNTKIGKIQRDGRTIYRFRAGEFRIYFSPSEHGILIHRIVHKNTLQDFLYRSNLPLGEEDSTLADNANFWKLIEPPGAEK